MRIVARYGILIITLLPAGCGKAQEVTFDRPNVMIITMDTVRADRLASYGHTRETTPYLDRIAREGVRFERAFSQSSFTPPSHASLLTSRYVSSHGVKWWNYRLPEEVSTIAEVFRDEGYRTASFSPLALGSQNGLDQGFDRVVEMRDEGTFATRVDDNRDNDYPIAPASEINKRVFDWISKQGDQPFMAWVHYYDAHRPFSIFSPDREFCENKGLAFGNAQSDYRLDTATRQKRNIKPRHAAYLADRYDSGLLGLDREVGKLVEHLKEKGLLENTILVITSDHGEAFDEFDKEWFSHDPFLFDSVTHVPLIIRFPGGRFAGKSVSGLVELIDVTPTILDYVSVDSPFGMQGQSMRSSIEQDVQMRSFVTSERQGKDHDKKNASRLFEDDEIGWTRSLRFSDSRAVIDVNSGIIKLYSIDRPNREMVEILAEGDRKGMAARKAYEHLLQKMDALRPEMTPSELSEDELRLLKELGYL